MERSEKLRGKNILSTKKGQSIIETALIMPIIILILMGIIDFGLLFNNYLVITNASREGARSAAVGSTDSKVIDTVISITSTLDQTKMTTSIYPSESLRKNGDQVTVTVDYDYYLLTPVISAIIPNPVHIKGKTVMRVE